MDPSVPHHAGRQARAAAGSDPVAVGVDVGGTKVAIGLVDPRTGEIRARVTLQTRAAPNAEKLLGRVIDAILRMLGDVGTDPAAVAGVGVGVPELVRDGVILTEEVLPGWRDLPVVDALAAIGPTRIDADVRLGALGEARFGAGRGHASFCYVTVGTGISFALVQHGRLHRGVHGGAINLGTTTLADLDSDGRTRMTLEDRVAGPALARRFREAGGTADRAEDVLEAASAGDACAAGLVDAAGREMGLGVALIANLLDPGLIVVGGGLGSADTRYWQAAASAAPEYIRPALVSGTRVVRAGLGPDSGLVGAGVLGHEHDGGRLDATGGRTHEESREHSKHPEEGGLPLCQQTSTRH